MRKAKALVIPFRFREGYPDSIIEAQLSEAKFLLNKTLFEYDYTEDVQLGARAGWFFPGKQYSDSSETASQILLNAKMMFCLRVE